MATPPTNEDVAAVFEDVAAVLRGQDANPHRVRAYVEAARTVRALDRPVVAILAEGGRKALEELPGIGKHLASSIDELAHSGRLQMLERLLGSSGPEDLFMLVPGIGEDLAHRIHERLGIETLEELELCAHDGRLATVKGLGPRRIRAVQEVLAAMLARSARRRSRRITPAGSERSAAAEVALPPTVAEILAIDARYGSDARAGRLKRIAPRRFNAEGKAWLPILHADEGGWRWTAMFSNTATAHRLARTDDWVVIYFERDGDEGQCTVVTEPHGELAGRRVVRGREADCRAHYLGSD